MLLAVVTLRCYRLIVEEGASVNSLNANRSTPLHIAAQKGYYSMVEMLLEQGADVNMKESFEIGAYIPLIHSVKGNHLQITELLWLTDLTRTKQILEV